MKILCAQDTTGRVIFCQVDTSKLLSTFSSTLSVIDRNPRVQVKESDKQWWTVGIHYWVLVTSPLWKRKWATLTAGVVFPQKEVGVNSHYGVDLRECFHAIGTRELEADSAHYSSVDEDSEIDICWSMNKDIMDKIYVGPCLIQTAVSSAVGYERTDTQTKGRKSIAATRVAHIITEAGATRVQAGDLQFGQSIGYLDFAVDHGYGPQVILDSLARTTLCSDSTTLWSEVSAMTTDTTLQAQLVEKSSVQIRYHHLVPTVSDAPATAEMFTSRLCEQILRELGFRDIFQKVEEDENARLLPIVPATTIHVVGEGTTTRDTIILQAGLTVELTSILWCKQVERITGVEVSIELGLVDDRDTLNTTIRGRLEALKATLTNQQFYLNPNGNRIYLLLRCVANYEVRTVENKACKEVSHTGMEPGVSGEVNNVVPLEVVTIGSRCCSGVSQKLVTKSIARLFSLDNLTLMLGQQSSGLSLKATNTDAVRFLNMLQLLLYIDDDTVAKISNDDDVWESRESTSGSLISVYIVSITKLFVYGQLLLPQESDDSAQLSKFDVEKRLAHLLYTFMNRRVDDGTYKRHTRGSILSEVDSDSKLTELLIIVVVGRVVVPVLAYWLFGVFWFNRVMFLSVCWHCFILPTPLVFLHLLVEVYATALILYYKSEYARERHCRTGKATATFHYTGENTYSDSTGIVQVEPAATLQSRTIQQGDRSIPQYLDLWENFSMSEATWADCAAFQASFPHVNP